MPPIESDAGREQIRSKIKEMIDSHQVLVFSKSFCPYCVKVKELFKELNVKCNAVELDLMEDGTNYQDLLHEMTGQKTVPNVFINKKHIGGCDNTMKAHKDGDLQKLLGEGSKAYDCDLIVIGGGSGGLACSKEAAALGKKVMVLDYVVPTPKGTSFLGLNVDFFCLSPVFIHILLKYWLFIKVTHNWETMRTAVNNYIGSLNWGYRVSLRDKNVNYVNAYAEFVEPHKIKASVFTGRDACTGKIGLDKAGVKVNAKNGKIPVNDEEQTSVPHIYAIGDILEGKWELTPVAIQAGKLLARRLFAGASLKCDYVNVPTTVFTPMEYGSCGYPEEKAVEIYGQENLEIYHSLFWPLEFTVAGRDNNRCYAKIICNKLDNDRVIGFHYLGPNAGEVTQGFGAAMKCGITKDQLDNTIGIHPTCAEIFTTMEVTKSSGGDITQSGC
ncbi:LOW QUALITY PROTEIN: thioredoxin reductase 3-like [Sinocyclocheilus grahami]|uniref:LOW QUALITY PROTEIN: thioredoxin reductase 3-like n=1 Tax=Sinocyclocheilus grahami TaxID=75366 RepID=UPI0007AC99AA|nr:PREDICTED: LOW QUALITY PROTEIN: thioredoxin reductase 3-like [Sinocyclocheilus grahami]